MNHGNIFDDVPTKLSREQACGLAMGPGTRIERIVSTGQASPDGFWYDQEQDEWVVVLKGRAALEFEDREGLLEMTAGDWVSIGAHERHRVAWTTPEEPTIWLAVHFPPGGESA